jgi:hypothetical protein
MFPGDEALRVVGNAQHDPRTRIKLVPATHVTAHRRLRLAFGALGRAVEAHVK